VHIPTNCVNQDRSCALNMKLNKTSEEVIRFKDFSGYLLIRKFKYDREYSNPIAEFMKTPYFVWQEKFRNKINVSINHSAQIDNWNFHGLYDIKKLHSKDFKEILAIEFVNRFNHFIESEIGFDKELKESKKLLDNLIDEDSKYYLIRNLPDNIRHEWSVFEFFLSGFKICSKRKILTAIECGLD